MRALWNVARLSVQLNLQESGTYVVYFVMPIAMMFLLAAALNFGGPSVRLDVENLDTQSEESSLLAGTLVEELKGIADNTDTIFVCVKDADDSPDGCDDSDSAFTASEPAATLIINAGFDATLRSGQGAILDYESDETLNSGTFVRTNVDTVIGRLAGSALIAGSATDIAATHFGAYENGTDEAARQADFDRLFGQANSALENPPVKVTRTSTGEEIEVGEGPRQSVPGIATMFVLIALLSLSADLVYERQQGTLQRLLTLPTARVNIVLGKILGRYVFGVIQFGVFIGVGMLLGINWGSSVPGIIALVLSFCLVGTALGFLLATIVKTADQAGGIATMMGLILAPLGGAWWSLDIVPEAMQTIGHISPIAWAMDGFNEILFYGGGLTDVLPMAGVMVAIAVVCTALAVMRFKYE